MAATFHVRGNALCLCILSFLSMFGFAVFANPLNMETKVQSYDTVENFLDALPYSMLTHYSLVFRSRSLQQADCKNPRVILFSPDGKHLITFNGSAQQSGYHALEMMDFDDQSRTFILHELLFPDQTQTSRFGVLSKANPDKCLKCHGNPPRPVWDTHPLWPGAIGEIYHAPLSAMERACLNTFLTTQAIHPRYSKLRNLQLFKDQETFLPSAKNIYEGLEREPPNASLSRLLSSLNMRAILYELAQSKNFPSYQYLLLAATDNDCGPLDDYLPESQKRNVEKDYGLFVENTAQKNRQQSALKQQRLADHAQARYSAGDMEELNRLRFVMEKIWGKSTASWTTALEKQSYDFTSPQTLSVEINRQLLQMVEEHDDALQSAASFRNDGQIKKYCNFLRKRSVAALQNLSPQALQTQAIASTTQQKNAGSTILKTACLDCHQGDVGPIIPFDQSSLLATALKQGGYPHGDLRKEILFRLSSAAGTDRMPPDQALSEDQVNAITIYFQELVGQPP